MTLINSIGWTDTTGNLVTGCSKVSPGCKNCYAEVGTRARVLRAGGHETWGPQGERIPVADLPEKCRRLNKLCICDHCRETLPIHLLTHAPDRGLVHNCADGQRGHLRRIRLFADSNSDWLDDRWPIQTFAQMLDLIRICPNVDFQLLTKRPENWYDHLRMVSKEDNSTGLEEFIYGLFRHQFPDNLWFGVSIENNAYACRRVENLRKIHARLRFLSLEPLLEAIDLNEARVCWADMNGRIKPEYQHPDPVAHWVIVGGESGKDRRDCGEKAIEHVAHQCFQAAVPVYVKQDCAFKSGQQGRLRPEIWKLKQFPATTRKT